jgi:hypothetical protein
MPDRRRYDTGVGAETGTSLNALELGIFSVFICGVDHRQDTRCRARIKRPCFKEVRCVRAGQLAEA